MVVDVKTKAVCQIDIDAPEAFRLLCKTLDMECVLDDYDKFYVVTDNDGDCRVCYTKDGHDETYDDRGELFIALYDVAYQMFPGVRKPEVYVLEE